MKNSVFKGLLCSACLAMASFSSCSRLTVESLSANVDWEKFLSHHDMYWSELTADPVAPSFDGGLKTGYYAGAIMGNGLLGTNLYKLKDNVYRLNVGRSDVTEVRQPYNLFNSARLPIGYFTLSTKGQVTDERMRLSLFNAETRGTFVTNQGKIDFSTYVHALHDYIVFETKSEGAEQNFEWSFVPLKAVSPRYVFNGSAPSGYLNAHGDANPVAHTAQDGEYHFLVQPLVTDSSMQTIGKVYVVAWREDRAGDRRRIIATISQERDESVAVNMAKITLEKAFGESAEQMRDSHRSWWNDFYRQAAFLSFPNSRFESFYWAQYYKFASTARPGKPIVDLQGVWPSWDTPWTAVWINLNLQLTYSWLTKANLGWLAEPLWESLYQHRDNLRRNVTEIPGQENWTDAACLGRTSSYDFLSPLDPNLADRNAYEVGNLTWLLHYYWQYCSAYGETQQLKERLFPMLKSAINLYFHIRTEKNGVYGLPPTASPEYKSANLGCNTNYDLSSLRWGLQTLLDINEQYEMNDPMAEQWRDFLDHLTDFPYDEATGYKVSDDYQFNDVHHRHYSHLFMIYPYHIVNWGQKENRDKIRLSVNRWKGNQGYSRTGKAAMLLSMGEGDRALNEMEIFMDRFVKPNTLYAETGPVIETPMAAVSTLQEFYMQDWGNTIRIFHGLPTAWKEASFMNMRALGGFLVSANRKAGKTIYIRIDNECGNVCNVQTDIPIERLDVRTLSGRRLDFEILDREEGIVRVVTKKGVKFVLTDRTLPVVKPSRLLHKDSEALYYGDGSHGNALKK